MGFAAKNNKSKRLRKDQKTADVVPPPLCANNMEPTPPPREETAGGNVDSESSNDIAMVAVAVGGENMGVPTNVAKRTWNEKPPTSLHLPLPSRLIVVAGTYDGDVIGYDTDRSYAAPTPAPPARINDDDGTDSSEENRDHTPSVIAKSNINNHRLCLSFAMPVHDGSVRSLVIASAPGEGGDGDGKKKGNRRNPRPLSSIPGILTTCGHDGYLHVYSLPARREIGEWRPPSSSFMPSAGVCVCPPPPSTKSTHLCLGTEDGKILLLDAKTHRVADERVVLGGHAGPVAAVAAHPSGSAALSCARGREGRMDGSIRLWDLTRAKEVFVHRIEGRMDAEDVRWGPDGSRWGYCAGDAVRVYDVNGIDGDLPLLDVKLGGRVNGLCFLNGGKVIAAGCEDGSLVVLAVGGEGTNEEEDGVVRGVMALYPARSDGRPAGNNRIKRVLPATFKMDEKRVVTATSGGIVAVWDLSLAIAKVLGREDDDMKNDHDDSIESGEEEEEEEEELAKLIQAVTVGSDGTRITDIAVWGHDEDNTETIAFQFKKNAEASMEKAADDKEDNSSKKNNHNKGEGKPQNEELTPVQQSKKRMSSTATQVKKYNKSKNRKGVQQQKQENSDRIFASDLNESDMERARALIQSAKKKERKRKRKEKK